MKKKIEYKGLYIQDKDQSVTYYEYGAHFSYKALCNRLEMILKNSHKDTNICYKKIFPNLKKVNSQKYLNNEKENIQNINISRNAKTNRNHICDKIINNDKVYKSKSINPKLELSKSFNDDLLGSFSLNSKNHVNNKNDKNKNYKEIKKREILFKKKSEHKSKQHLLLLNNKNRKILKNKHTVLKYVIIQKNQIDEKYIYDKYYGFSNNNNNNDSDIYTYGNDTSFNSTGNNCNYSNSSYNNNNNSYNKSNYPSKYKKIKISSIINKKFIKKSISDSPKNNSSSLIRSNTSAYYTKNKTHRMSENNVLSYSKKIKHNNSGIDFEGINDNNNNYYIENNNYNNYQEFYNRSLNKNILLNNNIKQKNKKLSIFNNFNKINFPKNEKISYLNSFKNPLILGGKRKIINSNKNSIIASNLKLKSNLVYNVTKQNSNSFLNTNKIASKNINIYNSTSNSKTKSIKKRLIKKQNSHNNILKINQNSKNIRHISKNNNKNNNLDSFTFFVEGENTGSKNKKSRNNNTKNIVNLLCCHFSINFNSPINLLNNIQNNIINEDNNNISNINNKTPKISSNNILGINNNFSDIKNNENININNISKSRNKASIIPNDKKIEKDVNKNKIFKKSAKISMIPINKEKNKKIEKNKISIINALNKKNNNFVKKKTEHNLFKGRLYLIKKENEQKINNKNKSISKLINKKLSTVNIKYSNNNSNNYSMHNISTSSNLNNNYL